LNKIQSFFTALFVLTIALACVVSGTQDDSPSFDPGLLNTVVAETVSAAVMQTEQVRSLTPTQVVGTSGSVLTIQGNSSTLYLDLRAGYEVTIPFGWLAVRVNEPEYLNAFSLAQTANKYIQKSLLSIQDQDPNRFRLFSFDVQEKHVQKEFVTNINFIWDEQGTISLGTDEELKARAVQAVDALPGLEILSTTIINAASGLPIGLIETKLAAKNSSGADIVVLQKQAIFKAHTGTMSITLSTLEGLKDTIFPEFDTMLGTINLITQ